MAVSKLSLANQNVKIVKMKISDLPPVQGISPSELDVLMGILPLLKNPQILNERAINLAVLQHPPLLRRKRGKGRNFEVIGNLRTLELCRQTLPSNTRVPCLVIEDAKDELITSTAHRVKLSTFLSTLWFGLDASASNNALFELANGIPRDMIEEIASGLSSKSGRERLIGLNRRHQPPQREMPQSPTSQQGLTGLEEDSNDDES